MTTLNKSFIAAARPYFSGDEPAFATTLVGVCLKLYGLEFLDWDPTTVRLELSRDFEAQIPRVVADQINALTTVMTTDLAYNDVPTFDQVVNGLTRCGLAEQQEPPAVNDIAWAVTEILLNDPEPVGYHPEKMPFDKDIKGYCRVVLEDEGFRIAPKVLEWVDLKRKPASEFTEDATLYAGANQTAQAMADEVDQLVADTVVKLHAQLKSVGIDVPSK